MAERKDSRFERQKYQSEQLVTLIMHATSTAAAWLKFLITVQGALAGAFGLIVLSDKSTWMRWALSFIICLFGAVLATYLANVIVRHQRWQGLFIKKHVALNSIAVFLDDGRPMPSAVSDVEIGVVATAVTHIRYCTV